MSIFYKLVRDLLACEKRGYRCVLTNDKIFYAFYQKVLTFILYIGIINESPRGDTLNETI